MSEYVARSEISPVDRVATRPATPVHAVQPVAVSPKAADRDGASAAASTPAVDTAAIDDDLASAAEYAKVHARIADILADLRSETTTADVDDAARSIQSLMPVPIIIVPLPPASKEAVEHAALLAKRMADQAVYARASHAHVSRSTVDQIVSTAI